MKLAFLTVLLASTGPSSFNLECRGTVTTRNLLSVSPSPYAITYRIDLDEKKWCADECKAVRQIYEVQPSFLTLEATTGGMSSYTRVDRETGEHLAGESAGSGRNTITRSWRGECRRAEFTGFPTPDTMF